MSLLIEAAINLESTRSTMAALSNIGFTGLFAMTFLYAKAEPV